MAKKRSVKQTEKTRQASSVDHGSWLYRSRFDAVGLAAAIAAGLIVYVAYFPSDSVAVEQGDALWTAAIALVLAIGGGWIFGLRKQGSTGSKFDRVVDACLSVFPWLLAGWMMAAAFGTAATGNLRSATNEGWLWVTFAATFTSLRLLAGNLSIRRTLIGVLIVCGIGLTIHGLHQTFVSLPQNRQAYREDPERVLELAGVEAPPGSAERMVFENRLFDGGPTGTFALANSLAAVLLVGGVTAAGVLRLRWGVLSTTQRIIWSVAWLLLVSGLVTTRSRSGLVAFLIGGVIILVIAVLRGRDLSRLWTSFAVAALAAIGACIAIAQFGNREWFEQAPASLAFRFQYWRSTLQMVVDRPLFGAGPGNFQAIYEQYREPSASETIAEPHNLWFETLASGGFVALILLLLIAAAIFLIAYRRHGLREDGHILMEDEIQDQHDHWVWLGAGSSLALIWLIAGFGSRLLDWQAGMLAVPVALVGGWLMWPALRQLRAPDLDVIAGVVLVTLSLHLMVAGGWTVPGVALSLWTVAAILSRPIDLSAEAHGVVPDHPPPPSERFDSIGWPAPRGWLAIAGGMALLITLYVVSIRPVERQQQRMAQAMGFQLRGNLIRSQQLLAEAAAVDPWSPEGPIWLADTYRWQLVLTGDDARRRQNWAKWWTIALDRAGSDPAIYRLRGTQQLHLYQRYGRRVDLEAAEKTFQTASQWSPANQWMIAQLAEIVRELGQEERSNRLAREAWELSELGDNIERQLSRQQIYLARHLGASVRNGPVRGPADKALEIPATER